MNHLFIWIHLISFIPGIALLVFLWIIYLQKRQAHVKTIIFADIFYTLLALLDTVDLYLRKNLIDIFPDNLLLNSLYDLINIAFTALFCYYAVRSIEIITRKLFIKRTGLFFTGSALLVFIIGIILDILGFKAVCANIMFLLGMFYYCIVILFFCKEQKMLDIRSKRYFYVYLTMLSSIGIYLIITNLVSDLPEAFYKIPVTPLLYFFLNTEGLIYANKAIKIVFSTKPSAVNVTKESFVDCNITERELEIIKLILEGQSNKDIAEKLFISVNTVKNHIYSVYRKIGIKNRYEMITYFEKNPVFTTENIPNQVK